MTNLEIFERGTVIAAKVDRWSAAREWPDDTSNVRLQLVNNGYWEAVPDDPAAPLSIPPVHDCLASITVLKVLHVPTVPLGSVRRVVARLEQLRAGLITAPEVRVLDECIHEVKRLLEEQ